MPRARVPVGGAGHMGLAAAAEHEQPLCSGSTLIGTAREGLLGLQGGSSARALTASPRPASTGPCDAVWLRDAGRQERL